MAGTIVTNGQIGLPTSRQMLAAAGLSYNSTNPTPGTAIAYSLKTSFSATANGLFSISNPTGSGVNVQLVFALTFAIGAGLAGLAGVVGGTALSISPGEDTRYLLASLVVVIVGGMGSVVGAAIGALLIGLAEQFGLAYAPTYSVVFTFVIMVLALAFKPRGILGKAA